MGGHVPAGAGASAGAAITAATTAGVVAAIGLDQDRHFAKIGRAIPGLYTDRHRIFNALRGIKVCTSACIKGKKKKKPVYYKTKKSSTSTDQSITDYSHPDSIQSVIIFRRIASTYKHSGLTILHTIINFRPRPTTKKTDSIRTKDTGQILNFFSRRSFLGR